MVNTQNSFDGLGIAPKLIEVLDKLNYKVPTPIQQQSIPIAIEGKDVMGIAQTGTGKTLAFGIPMLQRLAGNKNIGLILVPTRELAVQVNESLNKIGKSFGLRTAVLIGGESMGRQIRDLRSNPRVVVATPGRLIDHLEQKTIKLDLVNILVLDEADRMLDMGFAPQLKKILAHVPKQRQTMLFSATMEKEIVDIATSYLQLPIRVEVAPQGSTASKVTQEIYFVNKADKLELLKKVLADYKGSVLVFSRTKYGAKAIAQKVRNSGHTSAEIHSNRSLNQRLEALNGFKLGKYRVLIATDIAARGIDVKGIEVVINYDLPENPADYVHRIGRTGRAGHEGHAISFATFDQKRDVFMIERLIKKPLKVAALPELPKADPSKGFNESDQRRLDQGGRGQGRGGRRDFGGRSQGFNGRPRRDGNRPQRTGSGSFERNNAELKDSNPQGRRPGRPGRGGNNSFDNRRPKRLSDQERAKKMYWAK